MENVTNIVASAAKSLIPDNQDIEFELYKAQLDMEVEARYELDRAELLELYGEKYPDLKIDNSLLFEYGKMKREDAPCATCTGYPCAKASGKGFCKRVVWNDFELRLIVKPYFCKYAVQSQVQAKIEKQFGKAQLPKRYIGKTFDDYKVYAGNENAVKWAHYIIKNPKSLYLFGVPGAGKTLLAAIIAQEFLKDGKAVIFGDVPSLLTKMRQTFGENSENKFEDLLKTLTQAEILVFDDIGTESATEWAVEQMYEIINTRYNDDKVTIVTSNYNLNELAVRLNMVKNGKPGITGDRIARRLKEMCGVAMIEKENGK